MHLPRTLAIVVAICFTLPLSGQVDALRAEAYFKEAQAFCDRDGGRLWGISLCGPMVIADPATGAIATISRRRKDPGLEISGSPTRQRNGAAWNGRPFPGKFCRRSTSRLAAFS